MRMSEVSDEQLAQSFREHVVTSHILWDRNGSDFKFAPEAKAVVWEPTVLRMEQLEWRHPDRSDYYVMYHRIGSMLLVTGDLGEAVYRWYSRDEQLTLQWISNCNLDYFQGKCCASEVGSKYEEWDSGAAKKYLEEQLRELVKEKVEDSDDKESVDHAWGRAVWEIVNLGGMQAIETQDEWNMWLHSNSNFLGQYDHDWWEWAYTIGIVTHVRCRLHLLGLKMAFGLKFPKKEEANVAADA